jgi:hypothetical protein
MNLFFCLCESCVNDMGVYFSLLKKTAVWDKARAVHRTEYSSSHRFEALRKGAVSFLAPMLSVSSVI